MSATTSFLRVKFKVKMFNTFFLNTGVLSGTVNVVGLRHDGKLSLPTEVLCTVFSNRDVTYVTAVLTRVGY